MLKLDWIYDLELTRVKVSHTLSAPDFMLEVEKRGADLIEQVELVELRGESGSVETVLLWAGTTFPAPPRPME